MSRSNIDLAKLGQKLARHAFPARMHEASLKEWPSSILQTAKLRGIDPIKTLRKILLSSPKTVKTAFSP